MKIFQFKLRFLKMQPKYAFSITTSSEKFSFEKKTALQYKILLTDYEYEFSQIEVSFHHIKNPFKIKMLVICIYYFSLEAFYLVKKSQIFQNSYLWSTLQEFSLDM